MAVKTRPTAAAAAAATFLALTGLASGADVRITSPDRCGVVAGFFLLLVFHFIFVSHRPQLILKILMKTQQLLEQPSAAVLYTTASRVRGMCDQSERVP